MYRVKATRPKNSTTPPQLMPEIAPSHAAAVSVMIRLMREFCTVEIERCDVRMGFRQTSVR